MPDPEARTQRLADLDVDAIDVVANVRLDLREIEDLAVSIRERGILQPLVVVPSADGERVELLIGHRRLAAAKLVGLAKVPCLLRPRDSDVARTLDQLTENLHRDEMTALEKALSLKVLRDEGLTHMQIGARMRRSDQWVKNLLRLLTLPECVQRGVHLGWITVTKAIDIPQNFLNDPAAVQRLEAFLSHQGKNGLHLWYQDQYARRDKAEYRSEARARQPDKPMGDAEALRAGKEHQARGRAYNDAAQKLIAAHREEFERFFDEYVAEWLARLA